MHVLLLTTMFPPEVRSASQLMSELAGSLAARGHRVTVITAPADGPLPPERPGLRVIRIPTLPVHRTRAPAFVRGLGQLFNALAYLLLALFVPGVDVSIAYSPPLSLGLVGAALHRLRGIPHLLNVQDLVPQYAVDLGQLRSPLVIRALRWLERFVYRHVQLITVHSPGNADYLRAHGVPAEKIAVVPNWVDVQQIRPSPSDTAYRRGAGLEGKFVALFAGMMGFAQDLDTFLDAAALLRDHPDIALLLVGDGVEKPALQARAAAMGLHNVRFMPFVPAEAYPEVVASADVCLVSLQKSLRCPVVPAKLLGYMAAGRAIVASFPEGGDAPKLVREAGCGISVPAGEPAKLAAAILEASRNPEVCRRWGERGRAFAVERHDREKVMSLYESLFGQLARVTVPPAQCPPILSPAAPMGIIRLLKWLS